MGVVKSSVHRYHTDNKDSNCLHCHGYCTLAYILEWETCKHDVTSGTSLNTFRHRQGQGHQWVICTLCPDNQILFELFGAQGEFGSQVKYDYLVS